MAYANNSKALDVREQQLKVLHETIRNLQTQLLDNKTKEKENLSRISNLEDKLKQANVKELLLKTRIVDASKGSINSISDHASESNDSDKDVVCVDDGEPDQTKEKSPKSTELKPIPKSSESKTSENLSEGNRQMIDVDEARLIGLISSFLVVHPFGASLENISKYVQQVSMQLHAKDVEDILDRYKTIFNAMDSQQNGVESSSSITTERKWKFCGFNQTNASTIVIHD